MEHKDNSENKFEDMLEESLTLANVYSVGDRVTGKVVHIDNDNIFLDIRGKSEAILDKSEFMDQDGNITIARDDTIEAYIVSTDRGEINVSSKIGLGHTSLKFLEIACHHSIPVSGTPTEIVKGGYLVSVSSFSCFCPLSHIDIKKSRDPESMLGREFIFKIIEIKNNGKNIILSRKAILEEGREEAISELKSSLNTGDIVNGEIRSIHNFGIFVDIGGLEILLPRSEISWSRIIDTSQYTIGQAVSGKILSIDWENMKITMSLKQLTQDPWKSADAYTPGNNMNGTVSNIITQGAFVEIEPGLEGFIHVSKLSKNKRIKSPEEVLSIGEKVNVNIISINRPDKKMSLELITGEPDPWQQPVSELENSIHIGIVEVSKSTGLIVRLPNGMTGFVPKNQLIMTKSGDIQKQFPAGREIQVYIIEIKADNQKLILSEKEAAKFEQHSEYKEYMHEGNGSGTASLGNHFKQKFMDIKKKIENTQDD